MSAAAWEERIHGVKTGEHAALMDRILALPDAGLRESLARLLAASWLNGDPDGFLVYLDALALGQGRVPEAMERLAGPLMAALETAAGGQLIKGKLPYIATRLLEHLCATDPVKARQWAGRALKGSDLDSALAMIAPAMVPHSVEQALEVFGEIRTPYARLQGAAQLGSALGRLHPERGLAWANSLELAAGRSLAMGSVVQAISETNSAGAATALREFLSRIQQEYVQQRESDRIRSGVKAEDEFETEELYREYLQSQGQSLQPDTPEGDYLLAPLEKIAASLAGTDPQAALTWAESLATSLGQAHAISGALSGWSQTAPAAALDHYLQKYSDDAGMTMPIFENWAKLDPAAAVNSLQALTNPAQTSYAIRGLTSGWLESPGAAGAVSNWAAELPAGADRDGVFGAVISRTSHADPAAAWALVGMMENPSLRARHAQEVLPVLALTDPGAARAALQNYVAPPEELQLLQKVLQSAGS